MATRTKKTKTTKTPKTRSNPEGKPTQDTYKDFSNNPLPKDMDIRTTSSLMTLPYHHLKCPANRQETGPSMQKVKPGDHTIPRTCRNLAIKMMTQMTQTGNQTTTPTSDRE